MEEKRTYGISTNFEILKVFPGVVLEHVGGADVADLEIILAIAGGERVDGESKDARRVGESGGKDNKVGGELHVEVRVVVGKSGRTTLNV